MCSHTNLRLTDRWRCRKCGEPVTVEAKPWEGLPYLALAHDNPEEIREECLLRDPRHPARLNGDGIIRRARKSVEQAKELARARGNKTDARLNYKIPSEVWWGKIKESRDKKYWDDPSNKKKHQKLWGVES